MQEFTYSFLIAATTRCVNGEEVTEVDMFLFCISKPRVSFRVNITVLTTDGRLGDVHRSVYIEACRPEAAASRNRSFQKRVTNHKLPSFNNPSEVSYGRLWRHR